MDNFNWLNSITPIADAAWHLNNVIRISDIENISFYDKKLDSYETTIDPSHIKGIDYAYNYNSTNDITWIDLLNSLIRFKDIRKNKLCFEDLATHSQNDYDEEMTVLKFGDILITCQGQHRLALAKFLNLSKVKVHVIEYEFNKEKYDQFLIRKYFLDKLILWNLIRPEQYELALKSFGNSLSIPISGKYLSINDQLLMPFLETYRNLSTSTILKLTDKLFSYNLGDTNYNNRHANIENMSDIQELKPFLRQLKYLGSYIN